MSKCPTCGAEIKSVRSVKISNHFHGHLTQLARETGMSRAEVYIRVLLLACEIEVDGGSPYPYLIVDDVLRPARTTNRSNKQMMTAVGAVHQWAAERGVILNERAI